MFDFDKPEQRAILFLWSGCFQHPSDSGAVQGAAGNCRQDYVQGNMHKSSRECGKLQRKIEIQLQTTSLDHHNLVVTDYGYVEKVFTNLRRKLNRTEDGEVFDLKTNVLIWGLCVDSDENSNSSWLGI